MLLRRAPADVNGRRRRSAMLTGPELRMARSAALVLVGVLAAVVRSTG